MTGGKGTIMERSDGCDSTCVTEQSGILKSRVKGSVPIILWRRMGIRLGRHGPALSAHCRVSHDSRWHQWMKQARPELPIHSLSAKSFEAYKLPTKIWGFIRRRGPLVSEDFSIADLTSWSTCGDWEQGCWRYLECSHLGELNALHC